MRRGNFVGTISIKNRDSNNKRVNLAYVRGVIQSLNIQGVIVEDKLWHFRARFTEPSGYSFWELCDLIESKGLETVRENLI